MEFGISQQPIFLRKIQRGFSVLLNCLRETRATTQTALSGDNGALFDCIGLILTFIGSQHVQVNRPNVSRRENDGVITAKGYNGRAAVKIP